MNKLLAFVLLLSAPAAFAQNTYRSYPKDPTTYREHPLDMIRMKVEVSFEPAQGLVKGKVTHTFAVIQKTVDSVFFDAPGINIKTAALNGSAVPYSITKQGVWVKPAKALEWEQNGTIVFEYEATPRKGIYFIGWNVETPKSLSPWTVRKQVWTQGQGVDNRYWIPMYDDMNDKFITETVITFDKDYQVLSNGALLKKTNNKNNTITWHYSMSKPHAGYLLMLGIGKYTVRQTKSASGVPMYQWYYPEFPERAEPTYRYSEKMVDFLERETGIAYPWESYSQIMVQDFLYGAMENTTATIFGDFFNVDERAYIDRNYVGVNCHELTHQWFGDYITARDVRDTWLQESFATYYPKMFNRQILGEDEYNWQRRGEQNSAIEASKKDKNPVRHTFAGSPRNYPKGSGIISMLTYVLGEEQWKKALNHYLKTHAYANVETNDLNQAIQDKLGKDMSWFFDQWIMRGGEPHYEVSYETADNAGRSYTNITVKQIHQRDESVGLFRMPFVFEAHYTDGSVDRTTAWVEEENTVVKLENKAKKQLAFVLFDPNSMVMKSITFKKSFAELSQQVKKAPNMLDRYDALVALKEFDVEQKRSLLLEVFEKENFHAMKSEVINQLVNDPASAQTLLKVFQQSNPGPKLAAMRELKTNEQAWKSAMEKALTDSSYDVVIAAMEKLCKTFPAEAPAFLAKTIGVFGMHNMVNIKWNELSCFANENKKQFQEYLVHYASSDWEFRTRNAAFNSLKAVNYCDEKLAANLFDAILNPNSRLAGPASQLMEFFSQQTAYKNIMTDYYRKQNYSTAQKELIKKYAAFVM